MKSKGLLTGKRPDPLSSFKKAPVPSELENRRAADAPKPAPASPATNKAKAETRPKQVSQPKPVSEPKPTTQPKEQSVKASKPGTTTRKSLFLELDQKTVAKIDRLLGQLSEQSRTNAKRTMILQFRAYVEAKTPERVIYSPAESTKYRIDITVNDELKSKILNVEAQSPFEPDGTVLARYYASHFADFIEAIAE
ncbi:hypothetical protein [Celeribacter naphthalenivorans]|uniref:hypothetical protein n=1 Tax=Celeribacter naphthalenivorans TaxID=1614694 RepID=UPI001CFB9F9A|nr:hypothetical protein [Celeribacter naphthalenivorans]